jgi:hypothetical protein
MHSPLKAILGVRAIIRHRYCNPHLLKLPTLAQPPAVHIHIGHGIERLPYVGRVVTYLLRNLDRGNTSRL